MNAWGRGGRVRLAVARLADRLGVWCWADLVRWAMWPRGGPVDRAGRCKQDAARCGLCYCGRFVDVAAVNRKQGG